MTIVEIKWSIQVFFFKPAKIPSPIPSGTEITTEIIFKIIEVGNLSRMIVVANEPGSIVVERPQSNFVITLPSQFQYCSRTGFS